MILIFLLCLDALKSIEIQTLDPYYQVAYQSVKIDDEIIQPNQFFSYGLWSRYNPLSAISQVGPVGIFGSNCYQLLNIIDKVDGGITFMYFDCLHNEKYQITKEIKFVNDNGEQKVYETQIEAQEYESFWYFLEIIQWPIKKRFEIFIISQKEQKFFIMDQMKSPFKGKDLQLTFGGSLIVSKSKIESVLINQKFSYFPGKIIMQQFKILEELSIDDWFEYAKSVFEEYETCNCSPNQEFQIPDLNISSIQKGEFVSENKNCNSFFIQGCRQF
ncbi:unnamed protein product [Paramecium primaurelia]|uniref:Uncharacterized protein n=1 Tax=Paramecium primaurelia TaxID=5886 RepID=A0A8S1PFM4_PARPR|nr:unnamed protein product [Paramecium primaurelia]